MSLVESEAVLLTVQVLELPFIGRGSWSQQAHRSLSWQKEPASSNELELERDTDTNLLERAMVRNTHENHFMTFIC